MNPNNMRLSRILLYRNVHKLCSREFNSAATRACPVSAERVKESFISSSSILEENRQTIAPWIRIGEFEKGLLSHLSTLDILRAQFVLRMCSYDFIVDRSMQLFNMSTNLGWLGEWILRKTFFNQFVGGESLPRMTEVVQSLQKRGLRLMVAPVLEEDIEDQKSSKKQYNDNLNALIDLANMTSLLGNKKPILQLKLSAIMPPNTLEVVSAAINSECQNPLQLAKLVENIANAVENSSVLHLKLSTGDRIHFLDGLRRADLLVKKARELSVYVLVDAEFYSCKPAISTVALALMARYNRENHVVGNTIQGYLKDAVSTIKDELTIVTKHLGINWFGKVVRGAYVDRERFLAEKQSRLSPICDTYEETNTSYNTVIRQIMEHFAKTNNTQSHLVVATHNEKSIRLAAQNMKDLNITSNSESVSFAQIYGMADYLSTPLVQQGYDVYKSTPYGPIGRVIPYLARRASENRSVMLGAREELIMLRKELRSRILRL